jgi:hypothetical protein
VQEAAGDLETKDEPDGTTKNTSLPQGIVIDGGYVSDGEERDDDATDVARDDGVEQEVLDLLAQVLSPSLPPSSHVLNAVSIISFVWCRCEWVRYR